MSNIEQEMPNVQGRKWRPAVRFTSQQPGCCGAAGLLFRNLFHDGVSGRSAASLALSFITRVWLVFKELSSRTAEKAREIGRFLSATLVFCAQAGRKEA